MRIRRGMAAWRLAAALILVWLAGGAHAAIDPEVLSPVPKVQDGRLAVKTDRGEGELPIHVSRDWSRPQPGVRRAVITVHGWPRRDLRSGGYAAAQAGEAARGTIVIAPQFLIQADIDAHHLPDKVLRWGVNDWAIGYDAEAPAALSSFDALDAILTRLADKRLFPDLDVVVIAGHSTGGRFVQHYAAIGHGQAALLERGVHIRYVVSNPSIYLYFTAARPKPADAACGKTDHWEYGLGGALPRYARQPVSPAALHTAYLSRDIVISAGHGRHRPDRVPAGYHLRGRGPGRDPFRARRAKVVRGAGRRPPQCRDVRVRVRALRVVRPGAVRRDSGQALKVRLD